MGVNLSIPGNKRLRAIWLRRSWPNRGHMYSVTALCIRFEREIKHRTSRQEFKTLDTTCHGTESLPKHLVQALINWGPGESSIFGDVARAWVGFLQRGVTAPYYDVHFPSTVPHVINQRVRAVGHVRILLWGGTRQDTGCVKILTSHAARRHLGNIPSDSSSKLNSFENSLHKTLFPETKGRTTTLHVPRNLQANPAIESNTGHGCRKSGLIGHIKCLSGPYRKPNIATGHIPLIKPFQLNSNLIFDREKIKTRPALADRLDNGILAVPRKGARKTKSCARGKKVARNNKWLRGTCKRKHVNEFNLHDESESGSDRVNSDIAEMPTGRVTGKKSWSKLKAVLKSVRENFETLARKPKAAREIAERSEKRRAK
ncbi:hypothetical protein B0H16DRAFT_1470590 [Mycena metata]|uniref:Uncharacterized protein n=1 Tax=Mycena metata TaxID=1033252 RepID=A0AAD7HVE0_9AGAR|nr:hypothetical protein B0H16DRAFT_1470590 [Mycena metata]